MYYLFAIPIALLLFLSLHVLVPKFNDQEPGWLKLYAALTVVYIVATSVLFANYLSNTLAFSDALKAFVLGITGILAILLVIRYSPKRERVQGS